METVLLYILGVVIVALGVALSIGLHEIGHLVPAKLFGVRVSQYMIGFGPTVFSRRRGETEYGIKAIPLGGYISMSGMYPPPRDGSAAREASTGFFQTLAQDARTASAQTIEKGQEHRVFYKLPVWKRVIIMLGGPFMNLVIAVVLLAVILCGFGVLQPSTTVQAISACILAPTVSREDCTSADQEAPAKAAGVEPGDTITAINGVAITDWDQLTNAVQPAANTPLTLTLLRDGKKVTVTATPTEGSQPVLDSAGNPVKDAAGKPETRTVGLIGITPLYRLTPQPVTTVLPALGANIGADFTLIANLPQRLIAVAQAAFGSGPRDPNGPVGVLGVGRLAGEVAAQTSTPLPERFANLLGIVASLNVALLVFNLVPLMPLDGGHVIAALWEAVRRFFAKLFKRRDPGPVDAAKIIPLTFAVVIVLGAMSVLLLYADIVKPIQLQ